MDRGRYRIWWVASPPNYPVTMEVNSFSYAYRVLRDIYQEYMRVNNVGCGGLQVLDEKGNWVEWEDKNGNDIWDVRIKL